MDEGFVGRFWNVVCGSVQYLVLACSLLLTMLVILLVTLPLLESGTGSYVIAVLDTGIIVIALLIGGAMIGVCRYRNANDQ
ncbi:hypothetical protein [Halosimplex amylolyticum]|uniref:hypothetical protein n=1 Tax=Halosimplex amylolyticum TaxID=3396616 RepID=UPI003F57DFE1